MTNNEIASGADALKAYAESQSWFKARMAELQSPNIWREGAIDVIKAADSGIDQGPIGRQKSAVAGLHAALRSVGHEGELTDQQYREASIAVLAAVHELRGK
jgi:hypothetical protein